VAGFVRHDTFIMATRLTTLITVLVVYAISASKDGTFDTTWYRVWILFWISTAVIGPMIYVESTKLQSLVQNNERIISYSSVAAMILFVIYGQRVAAKTLFHHFMNGNYSLKRFSLQVVRFVSFALQAIHYGTVYGLTDPVFQQGAIGAGGAMVVVIWSIIGMIIGRVAYKQVTR